MFQNQKYKYKTQIQTTMILICTIVSASYFISQDLFYTGLLIEIYINFFITLFVIAIHRKRIGFLIKYNAPSLFITVCTMIMLATCYLIKYSDDVLMLNNIGSYWVLLLFTAILNCILFSNKSHKIVIKPLFVLCIITVVYLFVLIYVSLFNVPILGTYVLINGGAMVVCLYNLILFLHAKNQVHQHKEQTFYSTSLLNLQKEEQLKDDISIFLHDNVLQGLLSLKLLMHKSDNLEIKALMITLLDELNQNVRLQINQYHPMLKNLTLKDNYLNLIAEIKRLFPLIQTKITLHQYEGIFLPDPYHIIVYRLIKELLVNALKHSHATAVDIYLSLKKDTIFLTVHDNGLGFNLNIDNTNAGTGWISINNTIKTLDGTIDISSKLNEGSEINISIPLKGEHSYENFINR